MKLTFNILLFLLTMNLAFSQQQSLFTMKEVKEMPIFPGCEGVNPKHKKKIQACMTQQLTTMLTQKLHGFDRLLAEHQIPEALAEIQMVISKEGIILDVNATDESQPLLAEASIRALNQISEELPPIRPAKSSDGKSVNMYYQFPIFYTIELVQEVEQAVYPVDEIVLFTLKDGDVNYEVRLFEDRNIKVYEYKGSNLTYLGKFLSMREFEAAEPYRSILNNQKKEAKILVTQGYLDNELFEINVYNLFRPDSLPHLEVVKLENDKRTVVATFEKELDFSKSKFAQLIYRD